MTPQERLAIVGIAAMIREAVLRRAGGEAMIVADAVAIRLGEKTTDPEPAYLSVDEAAAIMGITRDAIDKRIQRRQVPGVVRAAGRRIQIDREKLLAGLARRSR